MYTKNLISGEVYCTPSTTKFLLLFIAIVQLIEQGHGLSTKLICIGRSDELENRRSRCRGLLGCYASKLHDNDPKALAAKELAFKFK